MKILHIVREIGDSRALETANAQLKNGHRVTLLLLHDAVLSNPLFEGAVVACEDDVRGRTGKTPFQTVDYNQILKMIFEHERVISW